MERHGNRGEASKRGTGPRTGHDRGTSANTEKLQGGTLKKRRKGFHGKKRERQTPFGPVWVVGSWGKREKNAHGSTPIQQGATMGGKVVSCKTELSRERRSRMRWWHEMTKNRGREFD